MIKYIKVCIAWIMLAAIICGLPGCQGDIPDEPNDQNQNNESSNRNQTDESKETSEMVENAPTYIRTGNTTDFVTSKIDIDAMLARPYDNTVPVAFSEGVFAIHYDEEKYAAAFAQLLDPQGFLATYGPTTVEQRNAGFLKTVFGAGCRWDGPSWPFATSQTLMAAANLLNYYNQNKVFNNGDWFDLLKTYAASQYKDGYSWIAEDLHPLTGEWIVDLPRSIHYNHSSYADLVITGLVGIRPEDSDISLTVNPLVGDGDLTHFVLENVSYRGHNITVLYDTDGSHYNLGAGMKIFVDGYLMSESDGIEELTVSLITPEN